MENIIKHYFGIDLNGNQNDYFKFISDKLKKVEISDYTGIFNKLGIDIYKLRMMNLEQKQCYINAANVCIYGNILKTTSYTEILYCEGYVTLKENNMFIEHAWNCIRNIFTEERFYFDITYQYVLNYSVEKINQEDYCVVHEYSLEELNKFRLKTMFNGPYINEIYNNQK